MKAYKVELIVGIPDDKVPQSLDWVTQKDFEDTVQEWFLRRLEGKSLPVDHVLAHTPMQYNPFSVTVSEYT